LTEACGAPFRPAAGDHVPRTRVAQITCPPIRIRPQTCGDAAPSEAPVRRSRSIRPDADRLGPGPDALVDAAADRGPDRTADHRARQAQHRSAETGPDRRAGGRENKRGHGHGLLSGKAKRAAIRRAQGGERAFGNAVAL
jgi:hypothetical protein